MEKLSLKGKNEQLVKFEELMNIYGNWQVTSEHETNFKIVRELVYRSDEYRYFIVETNAGTHTLFRGKK